MGDCNTDILPTLELFDARIAHTGYLTEGVRREKMLQRNLPLLGCDQEGSPIASSGRSWCCATTSTCRTTTAKRTAAG
jgi:hypothetical protein